MRPFRFLASLNDNSRLGEVASIARKAEAVGCSVFVLPDHLVGHAALLPLATVAAATERIRVGTFVLNVNLRHPAVLAQELATLDVLSGGRLEIGLGAGWNRAEQDAIGVPFESAGVRFERLAESLAVLRGCFADGGRAVRRGGPRLAARLHRERQGSDTKVRGVARAVRHQLVLHPGLGHARAGCRGARRTVIPPLTGAGPGVGASAERTGSVRRRPR